MGSRIAKAWPLLLLLLPSCGGDETVGASESSDTDGSTSVVDMPTTEPPTAGTGTGTGGSSGTPAECTAIDDPVCDDEDPCTVDECIMEACTHSPAADDTPCTDAGGLGGACRDGACVVDCQSDDECDDDNPCTDDVCDTDQGRCSNPAVEDGALDDSFQTDGDCRVAECEGGEAVDNADNSDLPDDDNDCTSDTCRGGAPVHEPLDAGDACGTDGLCDGEGACVDCLSPTDCDDLPVDDDCQTRTCEDGVCGQDFTDQGTIVNDTFQTDGDCQVVVCDGSGGMESEDDDVDVPVDGLECTDDVCTAGVPSNPDEPEGTTCAAGVCDDGGMCVDCNVPADCGGTNTFCQTITCIANTCGVSNTVAGIPLPVGLQTPNDCQELQCNGSGGTQSVPDDADIPVDDGNQCTSESCNNGFELHPDEPIDTTCDQDGGFFCDGNGACVECNSASQCSNAVQCEVDACTNNSCVPEPDNPGVPCDDGLFCTATDTCDGAGSCTGTGAACPGPDGDNNCSESCNEATDSCDADDPSGSSCEDGLFCTDGDQCNAVGTCVGGGNPCVGADGDDDCTESCDEAANDCTAPDPSGSLCDDGLFCTTGDTCNIGGTCVGGASPCDEANDGDSDCNETCDEAADSCLGQDPDGSGCDDGLFCTATDTCSGGVCGGAGDPCDGADGDADCSEICDEVSNTCTGNDPPGSPCADDGSFCTGVETCNGSGACVSAGDPCPGPDGDGDCQESCDEAANDCTANDPEDTACDDGVFCNGADRCGSLGGCGRHDGDPCPGPDGDGNCQESCDETSDTCTANDPVDSACDDGVFCNGADRCGSLGGCGRHDGDPCVGPDGDGNCSESCNEAMDDCTADDPAGSACTDGTFCNGADTCDGSGGCTQHAGDPCPGPDGDVDCTETCDEASASCTADDPNGSVCCTIAVCFNGVCGGFC